MDHLVCCDGCNKGGQGDAQPFFADQHEYIPYAATPVHDVRERAIRICREEQAGSADPLTLKAFGETLLPFGWNPYNSSHDRILKLVAVCIGSARSTPSVRDVQDAIVRNVLRN